MAAHTDISLDRLSGASPIKVSVGSNDISYTMPAPTNQKERDGVQAIADLANILQKPTTYRVAPEGGEVTLNIQTNGGPDNALAIMMTNLLHTNGVIAEDQAAKFSTTLATNAKEQPKKIAATEQTSLADQLKSIGSAMANSFIGGMQEAKSSAVSAKGMGIASDVEKTHSTGLA